MPGSSRQSHRVEHYHREEEAGKLLSRCVQVRTGQECNGEKEEKGEKKMSEGNMSSPYSHGGRNTGSRGAEGKATGWTWRSGS